VTRPLATAGFQPKIARSEAENDLPVAQILSSSRAVMLSALHLVEGEPLSGDVGCSRPPTAVGHRPASGHSPHLVGKDLPRAARLHSLRMPRQRMNLGCAAQGAVLVLDICANGVGFLFHLLKVLHCEINYPGSTFSNLRPQGARAKARPFSPTA